jgi:tetratricopeptide (TPR) repeat protein
MKKKIAVFLGLFVFSASFAIVQAKTTVSSDLANAIKLYKSGNYTECYTILSESIMNDSGNALAYYYLAMSSAQVGKKSEAIANYEKAILLAPRHSNLKRYAIKGKVCLVSPEKCENALYGSEIDKFIQAKKNASVTKEVRGEMERLKIENMMREMNRSKDIQPERFKEYKDFSSMNTNEIPGNDEIVAAMRVLQKAGFSNYIDSTKNISMLSGSNLTGEAFDFSSISSMSPELIQSLFTNNMSLGF